MSGAEGDTTLSLSIANAAYEARISFPNRFSPQHLGTNEASGPSPLESRFYRPFREFSRVISVNSSVTSPGRSLPLIFIHRPGIEGGPRSTFAQTPEFPTRVPADFRRSNFHQTTGAHRASRRSPLRDGSRGASSGRMLL